MKKIIRLTEKDLTRIVKRVIKEQDEWKPAPAKGNDHLNEFFAKVQAIGDYVRDTYEFTNKMEDFYGTYQEDIDELTDEEYNKLEYFINKIYREVQMDKDNMNGSMYDDDDYDDELIDADDY